VKLELCPTTRAEADEFIRRHHRHHGPTVGAIFRLAVSAAGEIVGVAVCGRPVARHLDDGFTIEVLRCCTNGTKNACSMLYGAAWRAAKALGFRRIVTYTIVSEPGASLRGAGWQVVHQTKTGSWNCQSRPRVDTAPTQAKLRWEPQDSTLGGGSAQATQNCAVDSRGVR
jgi:hypothetical protein